MRNLRRGVVGRVTNAAGWHERVPTALDPHDSRLGRGRRDGDIATNSSCGALRTTTVVTGLLQPTHAYSVDEFFVTIVLKPRFQRYLGPPYCVVDKER